MRHIASLSSRPIPEPIQHAGRSFGHLVARGETVAFDDFARRISDQYDETNPQTAEVVAALQRYRYGRIKKDQVNALPRCWLPDVSRLRGFGMELIAMTQRGEDSTGFMGGDTVGSDWNFGRERLDYLVDMGYLVRTGKSRANGLGGVWPEVVITAQGKAMGAVLWTALQDEPISPIDSEVQARRLAQQLPLCMNLGRTGCPVSWAFSEGTEPVSDSLSGDLDTLVEHAQARMFAFGSAQVIEDWKDARRLRAWVADQLTQQARPSMRC
jgi:hypothetical protein